VTVAKRPRAMDRVIDFIGDLGPRWGLPREACRVHGYIYLFARPVTEVELRDALELSQVALEKALAWHLLRHSDFRGNLHFLVSNSDSHGNLPDLGFVVINQSM
jgi:hypothetical protein